MTSTARDAIEDAWRIHAALVDWTGKVDSKSSFALAIDSAVLTAVAALSAAGRPLGDLRGGDALWAYRGGILALALATLGAVAAVIPRVRFWQTLSEWEDNVVFFGHVRHWKDPAALAKALQERDMLLVLARQHIAMSRIAWNKHVCLQVSLALTVLGSASVTAAALCG